MGDYPSLSAAGMTFSRARAGDWPVSTSGTTSLLVRGGNWSVSTSGTNYYFDFSPTVIWRIFFECFCSFSTLRSFRFFQPKLIKGWLEALEPFFYYIYDVVSNFMQICCTYYTTFLWSREAEKGQTFLKRKHSSNHSWRSRQSAHRTQHFVQIVTWALDSSLLHL